jgi:hypothetical protein
MDFYTKLPKDDDVRGLFAFDIWTGSGAKCYVRAPYHTFIDHLAKIPYTAPADVTKLLAGYCFSDLCAYEIMRPGCPTKLFLDLEYDLECNKDLCHTTLLKGVILDAVLPMLEQQFQIPKRDKRTSAVFFCASNDKKCSYHVIFPDIVFDDYSSVALFTKEQLIPKFKTKYADVNTSSGGKTSFIDPLGGRHRAFRLPYQSKKKDSTRRPLLPRGRAKVQTQGCEEWKRQILKACAQHVLLAEETTLLHMGVPISKPSKHFSSRSDYMSFMQPILQWIVKQVHPITKKIRQDVEFSSFDLVNKHIILCSRDHYCDSKCGYHRNNNVFYVVDLEKCCYYQRCYSAASCLKDKTKRVEHIIPTHILEKYREYKTQSDELFKLLDTVNI